MTPEAAFALLAIVVAVAGSWVAWNRADAASKARNDIVADRVAKLEAVSDRVTTLEANERNGKAALEKHYQDDMNALAKIESSVDRMRTELLASMSEIRADIRARLGHEDTDPRR